MRYSSHSSAQDFVAFAASFNSKLDLVRAVPSRLGGRPWGLERKSLGTFLIRSRRHVRLIRCGQAIYDLTAQSLLSFRKLRDDRIIVARYVPLKAP